VTIAARPRVLVVDDDAAFATMVTEVLQNSGYDAHGTTDAEQALEVAGRDAFAAAVVDLVMPGVDGLDLVQRLKSLSADTEVVILTGHADVSSAIEGIRAGVFDYLQKPSLEIARLERTVRAAVERSALTRENRRLVEDLAESNRLLRTLNDLSARLADETHLDRVLAALVDAARTLTGAEAARALLLDRHPLGDFVIRKAAGSGQSLEGSRFSHEGGLAMLAAHTGAPVRAEQPRSHPSYSPRCDEMPAALPGLLCSPMNRRDTSGVLMVAGRARPFSAGDEALLLGLARQGAVAIENAIHEELNQNFFTHASEMLVSLLDSQDVHLTGHSRAVAAYSDMVTRRLGLSEQERWTVHFAGLLHDIGKLLLGPQILSQDGKMSEEAWKLMREHPTRGLEILRPITKWEGLLPIIHAHHERWDGRGYPRGLAEDAIPLGARIVSVAEAFDVMTRRTPQGPRRAPEEALAELEACAGTQFDPKIVRLFVAEYRAHAERLGG
jgi:putative nucleotidyltransferase with HDIG domain